jgi:hypothetical protein
MTFSSGKSGGALRGSRPARGVAEDRACAGWSEGGCPPSSILLRVVKRRHAENVWLFPV